MAYIMPTQSSVKMDFRMYTQNLEKTTQKNHDPQENWLSMDIHFWHQITLLGMDCGRNPETKV